MFMLVWMAGIIQNYSLMNIEKFKQSREMFRYFGELCRGCAFRSCEVASALFIIRYSLILHNV